MLNHVESAARATGYVRSPNDPARWYAGAPGIPELRALLEVHIENDPDLPVAVYAHEYATNRLVPLFRFDSWSSFFDFAKEHGKPSRPGMPAFSNAWD